MIIMPLKSVSLVMNSEEWIHGCHEMQPPTSTGKGSVDIFVTLVTRVGKGSIQSLAHCSWDNYLAEKLTKINILLQWLDQLASYI